MDISEITSDPFWNLLFKHMDNSKLNEIEGVLKKAEGMRDSFLDILEEYLKYVSALSDKNFDEIFKTRETQMLDLQKSLRETLMKTDSIKTSIDEIGALALVPEIMELSEDKINEKFDKIELSEDDFKKLFLLEFVARIELFSFLLLGLFSMDKKNRIESIIKRNFNNDHDWAHAVSILAIHENLVKKKLEKMGMTKEEIKDFLKKNGNRFENLVDHLENKIKQEEKRTPSLSFYRSHALRDMRNKIEHEGYDVKITSDDVNDLLNDIEKFEKELFPEEKS